MPELGDGLCFGFAAIRALIALLSISGTRRIILGGLDPIVAGCGSGIALIRGITTRANMEGIAALFTSGCYDRCLVVMSQRACSLNGGIRASGALDTRRTARFGTCGGYCRHIGVIMSEGGNSLDRRVRATRAFHARCVSRFGACGGYCCHIGVIMSEGGNSLDCRVRTPGALDARCISRFGARGGYCRHIRVIMSERRNSLNRRVGAARAFHARRTACRGARGGYCRHVRIVVPKGVGVTVIITFAADTALIVLISALRTRRIHRIEVFPIVASVAC